MATGRGARLTAGVAPSTAGAMAARPAPRVAQPGQAQGGAWSGDHDEASRGGDQAAGPDDTQTAEAGHQPVAGQPAEGERGREGAEAGGSQGRPGPALAVQVDGAPVVGRPVQREGAEGDGPAQQQTAAVPPSPPASMPRG
jgi:hypothetical protein